MKKNLNLKSFVAIFAASTLFACTQDSIDNLSVQTEEETEAMNELPKRRTYEEALAVAQDAIGLLGENCTTRSGKPRSINTADVQYIINTSSTRSTEEPDTLMYVFNYEDNAGFAVVSANRATEELIAVTEQGNYVAGEETGNGGFDLYMDMAEEYTSIPKPPLKDSIDDGMEEFTQVRDELESDTISYGPYLQVRWGQYWPYNLCCYTTDGEKAHTGCAATAIAQIATYYKHPTTITINYDGNSQALSLNWDEILQHTHTNFYVPPYSMPCYLCESTENHQAIGKFVRQIGKYLSMTYGSVGAEIPSESTSIKTGTALSNLGYAYGTYQNYSRDVVENSLRQSQLVCMRGGDVTTGDGHAWVVDGFRIITETVTTYIKPDSQLFWEILRQVTSSNTYFHINWGWDGDCNGYFYTGSFDTQRPARLDSGMSNRHDYDFERELKIYPNIRKR